MKPTTRINYAGVDQLSLASYTEIGDEIFGVFYKLEPAGQPLNIIEVGTSLGWFNVWSKTDVLEVVDKLVADSMLIPVNPPLASELPDRKKSRFHRLATKADR